MSAVTVRVALVLAVIVFVMQAAVVRPRLWPAGAGLVISGDTVLASLGEARIFAALRPPDVRSAGGRPATIARVWPGGPADRAGVRPGMIVTGVMTYEALTGSLPFGAGSFVDVAMRQASARARVETTGLSPAVANVVLGAIAYERDERPATPTAFADAVRRAIGG